MADVYGLKRKAGAAHNASIPETDNYVLAGAVRATSGTASLWADANTTAITVGGGAGQTTMTLGKAGQTATFLGSATVTQNLVVSGTTTTLNTTNLVVADRLILLNSGGAGADSGIAIERTDGLDAVMLWEEANDRFEFGTFETDGGTTVPGSISSFSDVKMSSLLLAGTAITADGALTVTAAATDVQASGTLSLDSSAAAISIGGDADAFAINVGTGAAARTITVGNSTGATSVVLNSGTGAINVGTNAIAHTITLGNSTGATSVVLDAGTGAINVGTNAIAHTITLGNSTGATSVVLDSGTGAINVGTNAIAHTITLGNSTGATSVVLDSGTGAINVGTNAVAHTIAVGNTTGATAVTIDAGSGGISLDTAVASNFTVSGASADLTLGARGSTITLNQSGEASLQNFTATSIIGALNELKDGASALHNTYTNNSGVTTIDEGMPVYIVTTDNKVSPAHATTDAVTANAVGFAEGSIAASGSGFIVTEGVATVRLRDASEGELTPAAGSEVFLSTTTGKCSTAAPATSGNVVLSIGFVKDASAYVTVTNPLVEVQLVRGSKSVVV